VEWDIMAVGLCRLPSNVTRHVFLFTPWHVLVVAARISIIRSGYLL